MVIILWGAWVRISGSGDGCGKHWPLCHGELFPAGSWYLRIQTWIEYAHRAKSGLFGILIFIHSFLVWRSMPSLRHFAAATSIFTITEALFGAVLVLGGYVHTDQSIGRAIVIAFHLGNTLLLVGSITALWWALSIEDFQEKFWDCVKKLSVPFSIIFLIAVTGAWAALSTTLFPITSISEGLISDFSETSHFLERIKIIHPIFAVSGAYLLWVHSSKKINKLSALLLTEVIFGVTTLLFHSPVWMKLGHLLLAQLVWIGFVEQTLNNKSVKDRDGK